jgi:hypothetical protein
VLQNSLRVRFHPRLGAKYADRGALRARFVDVAAPQVQPEHLVAALQIHGGLAKLRPEDDPRRLRPSRRRSACPADLPDTLLRLRAGVEERPEHEALVADSVGPALLAILDTLTPAERD